MLDALYNMNLKVTDIMGTGTKTLHFKNLNYEGTIPALHYYEPQQMDAKKKKDCEDWHAEEVLRG